MKNLIALLFMFYVFTGCAQKEFTNVQKGYAAEGYDVVAYFENKAVEGKKQFELNHNGIVYRFVSQENQESFKQDPEKFIPQYGGYCAYAIATKSEKVSINPKAFEIRDGKLYLFYHTVFANTLEMWLNENPEQLKIQADQNWVNIVNE